MYLDNDALLLLVGMLVIGTGTSGFALIASLFIPARVVEWRLDPPEDLHQFDGSIEPSDAELADIDRQKQMEVLYHAMRYNKGKCTTQRHNGLFTVIEKRWNERLKEWPQYRHWHIGYHWMREAIAKMDYDTSRVPVVVADGNSAGLNGGYYVLISPSPTARRGEHAYRRLVALDELVTLWRKVITKEIFIDATDLKADATASSPKFDFDVTGDDSGEADVGGDEDEEPEVEPWNDVTK